MKCPKCGYLGFETTNRCRNCGYDFSLSPAAAEPELTLQTGGGSVESLGDFDMPAITRATDPAAGALDLDRLFGTPAPVPDPAPVVDAPLPVALRVQAPETAPSPAPGSDDVEADPSALPFDEAPLLTTPRPARPPLAVRRATPEFPRGRSRTTRPVRMDAPLALGLDAPPAVEPTPVVVAPPAIGMAPPSAGVRLAAGAIDVVLLTSIFGAVLMLTLRIAGLAPTLDDVRVLPPVPFLGFVLMVTLGYLASFTVAGGQTIGKMSMKIKVIGDDGRSVDAAGGVLRAMGSLLVPFTLGLTYMPVFFTSDHRALHDRLAGTRVVYE